MGRLLSHWRKLIFLAFSILLVVEFAFPDIASSVQTAIKPICAVQGDKARSPLVGRTVTTRGVVYLDLDDISPGGFYIQHENCDADPDTSDGIFVYLDERVDVVNIGDEVEVRGVVEEYYGMTEIRTAPENVTIRTVNNPLPELTELSPPFDMENSRLYFESLEGMFVGFEEAVTVGPTDGSAWSWVVSAGLGIDHVFWDDPLGTGEIVCVGDGGLFGLDPQVKTGDHVLSLRGALDYELGVYCLQPSEEARVVQNIDTTTAGTNIRNSSETGERRNVIYSTAGNQFSFRAATFNLYNLFDAEDDPETDDTIISAAEYQRRLQKRAKALAGPLDEPEIVGLQEVENQEVLKALVARPELTADYGYVWENTPDRRGLDVALLFRKDRVKVLEYQSHQGCTKLVDGLGPDGNGDVKEPQNALTCDTDANGSLDGNRLFSRPPLSVQILICEPYCSVSQNSEDQLVVWLINNHFKSRIEDSLTTEFTLPRRIEQSKFVAHLVGDIRSITPEANILVMGDLNDRPGSIPITTLADAGLKVTISDIPRHERYTYIFQGISQELDYILSDFHLPLVYSNILPFHFNADYPKVFEGVNGSIYRSSDHDPVVIQIKLLDYRNFIPITLINK